MGSTSPSTDATPAPTNPTTDPTSTLATTPATSPATTAPAIGTVLITSEDGDLTLEVDAADAARVDPTVRILDPSEWPAELGDADQLPGVTIYELGPDGAVFDQPVTVTRRLDVASFGDSVGAFDVPLVVPFTQEDDGRFVPLDGLRVARVGSSLYASGTTTHFSPLGTIDLGMDLRYPGSVQDRLVVPELDADDYLELALSYEFADVPSVAGGVDALDGAEPEVVPRRIDPGGDVPFFGPIEVTEVERTAPQQSSEEDAAALYRLLSKSDDVPSSPLFAADGVEVPEVLELAVLQYLLSEDAAERERLAEIADVFAAGVGLEWSVVHTPIGDFPSFSRIRLTKVPQLEEGEELFAALYTGTLGADAQFVDLAAMAWEGDAYGADVGLTNYGEFNQALIVTPAGSAPEPETSGGALFDSGVSLTGEVMLLFLDQPLVVGPDEGVAFDGDVGFERFVGG